MSETDELINRYLERMPLAEDARNRRIAELSGPLAVQRLADLEGDTVRVGLTVAAKIAAGEGHDHG